MSPLDRFLSSKLEERTTAGNLRTLSVIEGTTDFYSNDYLGLVTCGTLAALLEKKHAGNGTPGSTGSRLLSGNNFEVLALEQKLAAFYEVEAALIFNSGYNANIGLLASIVSKDSLVLYDEYCHASIIDGLRLSLSTKKFKYQHNCLTDLEDKLKRHQATSSSVLVVTESIFSMDGDMAPLKELTTLCKKYGAEVIVDEAHATGIFGKSGVGLVSAIGLTKDVFARIHTFGKALGCHGAVVLGNHILINYLINFARPFLYTTALPGHSIAAIDCAYDFLESDNFNINKLHNLINYFRTKIEESGFANKWVDSISPIQVYFVGDNVATKNVAQKLQENDFQIKAILSPTVPKGKERLRICLHIYNTFEEIDKLFDHISN